MTRRRWIADEVSNNRAALIGEHADHLVRVLRARVGQEFDISAGAAIRRGRIVDIAGGRVEFELGEEIQAASTLNLSLVMAVFKFDRMEWAIEKCTELGIERIVPVIAARTDPHLASAAVKRVERWRRIARQAGEQSRRALPPEVVTPLKLAQAMTLPAASRIVLSEVEREVHLRDLDLAADGETLYAIGPEGGWTEDELASFHAAGWLSASLGATILRAETAAIAAAAVLMAQLSEPRSPQPGK